MKKNLIAVIIDLNKIINTRKYINYYELIDRLQDNSTYGAVLDISQVFRFKSKKINFDFKKVNKNQLFFQPLNFLDLVKFLKFYKCIAIYNIPNNVTFLIHHFFLRILNIKRFMISGLGYLSDNSIDKNTSIKNKFLYFKNYRLSYYLFRIFQILSLIKNIDFYFEASQKIIDDIDNSFSNKLKKKIKLLNFSYYRNKIRVNSNSYNYYLKNKNNFNIVKKYIVLIDSGFDHPDRIIREGVPNDICRIKYYERLNNFLLELQELTSKKVIICLHPKVNYGCTKEYLKIKENFKTVLNRTEEFIYQSDICIFFESSAIVNAILLKKKIINLNTKLMGDYFFKRNNLYKNYMDLHQINIDKYILPKKKVDLYKNLENKIENYEKYISKNVVNEANITSYEQIKSFLKRKFFNQ
jgi:hypothetical protein